MFKITNRDIEIKKFLEEVQVADTKTLSILFFNDKLRAAQKRLKKLSDEKYIKCYRENMLEQDIFYIKKRSINWKHKIIFSQLLAKLKLEEIEVLKYRTPYQIENVIADGLIVAMINNEPKIYFVEGERKKKFDLDKYVNLYYSRKWKKVFPVFPSILLITDNNYKTDQALNIINCGWNLDDLNLS